MNLNYRILSFYAPSLIVPSSQKKIFWISKKHLFVLLIKGLLGFLKIIIKNHWKSRKIWHIIVPTSSLKIF